MKYFNLFVLRIVSKILVTYIYKNNMIKCLRNVRKYVSVSEVCTALY